MIKPTVGRVVWYRRGQHDGLTCNVGEPLAAVVATVWNDHMVNLMVIDGNGQPTSRTSVHLRQDDEEAPQGAYCEWMPYQKGQAAKTEALEKELGK